MTKCKNIHKSDKWFWHTSITCRTTTW